MLRNATHLIQMQNCRRSQHLNINSLQTNENVTASGQNTKG